jgi:serralysin
LNGGAGQDVMTGGLGADTFEFFSAADSLVASPDSIHGFEAAQDLLSVNGADHSSAFVGPNTIVSLDFDHDTVVDSKVSLTGHITLTASNFI